MTSDNVENFISIHKSISILVLILFFGCNTSPVSTAEAIRTPPERLLAFQRQTSDKCAKLIFIRDDGFIGSGCYFALYINGVLSARLDPREIVQLYVEPGEILLKVGSDPEGKGLCGVEKGNNWTQRETIVKSGETKYFRLSMDTAGKFDIYRTDL